MFYLFRLFYSFLPLHNPIGFGAADFIEWRSRCCLWGLRWRGRNGPDAANRLALENGLVHG